MVRCLAHKGVSASTQNQAFNAVLFFYREVLKPDNTPVARYSMPVSAAAREKRAVSLKQF